MRAGVRQFAAFALVAALSVSACGKKKPATVPPQPATAAAPTTAPTPPPPPPAAPRETPQPRVPTEDERGELTYSCSHLKTPAHNKM